MNEKNDEVVEEATDEKPQEEVTEAKDDSSENESEEAEEVVDWEARALKAEKLIQKNKDKVKKNKTKAKTEDDGSDITLARLETRGVMESDDQEYVIRFAKLEGISPIEALKDPIVMDRISANQKSRKSDGANPSGNNRGRGAQNEVDVAVKKYKKDGTLPDNNPALTVKVLNKLKNEQ